MLFKSLTWGCDVIAKNGNGCEEIAGRWQNNRLCPKQIRLLGVINVKIQTERHCPVKHFAFLKNVCYQYYNFVLWVTYCFLTSCWLAHNQLSWSVLLLPCNLIGQLCLRCPGYTAFQFILSCRPSEGSPRPHANFFRHILLNTYAICWARKPSLPGHWPETHFSSRTMVTVVALFCNIQFFIW